MNVEKTLRDALSNQRKQSLTEVLPLACETVLKTDNFHTFVLAGDVIDKTWIRMSPYFQYWHFERVIYSIYWSRIGSIENIEKQLRAPYEDAFFWDSMSWVRSVKNIGHYNHKLYKYFEKLSKSDDAELLKIPRELKGRAVDMKNRKLAPNDSLKNILNDYNSTDAMIELSYNCYSIESARLLLDSIIQEDSRISRKDGITCINNLLLTNRSNRVRKYVLNRLHSERFYYDEKEYLSFFSAAVNGVKSDTELEIIKSIGKPFVVKHPEVKEKLKLASENLAIEKFQCESIRKSPIVKEVIRTYGHLK
jgi:hypothetical protein